MIEGMIQIYGINNCDSCRKARKWLDDSGRQYRWHDLRQDGPDEAALRGWVEAVGVKHLVNRRSTTWRGLDEGDRARAADPNTAPGLLSRYPTLIKRPVFELTNKVLVGFDESVRQAL